MTGFVWFVIGTVWGGFCMALQVAIKFKNGEWRNTARSVDTEEQTDEH